MNMSDGRYIDYIEARQKKQHTFSDCVKSFFVGGAICAAGQLLSNLFISAGADERTAGSLVSITLIVVAELLTALGAYYPIARFAGAGTLVPITGFANAIASPAIDAKSEGFLLGVGAKAFTIAGPVILYGTAASVIYGVIYYAATL